MAANAASVNLPNNPRRHSLIVFLDQTGLITVKGIDCLIPNPQLHPNGFALYSWDDWGDSLNLISKISASAPATTFIVLEQYREEVPEGQ